MLWLLMIGLLSVNLTSRYQFLKQVNYTELFPKPSVYAGTVTNKRIMIVGDDLSLFQENKLAGYFLDWKLSRKYFEAPDLYENIITINKAIEDNAPDVIVDELGLMEPIIGRIPMLKKSYRKENNLYWKR